MSAAEGTRSVPHRRPWVRHITRPDRKTLAAVLLLVVSASALAVVFRLVPLSMSDIAVYRAEGEAAASGGDLYGFTVTEWKLPATYPPFAALLFIPTTWLPLGALKVASVLVNVALIPVLLHLSYKAAYTTGTTDPRGTARLSAARTLPAVLAATALAIWLNRSSRPSCSGRSTSPSPASSCGTWPARTAPASRASPSASRPASSSPPRSSPSTC
ncbi:hypothetical protein SRIMM317S_05436 [Streptomyces rimosus subsp. rimosus]